MTADVGFDVSERCVFSDAFSKAAAILRTGIDSAQTRSFRRASSRIRIGVDLLKPQEKSVRQSFALSTHEQRRDPFKQSNNGLT